jgi:hypothetical protein
MAQRARRYQEYLRDELINNLYSDNLSDMPDDIFSESDTVTRSDKEGVNVLSECESGSEGSDSDDTSWVKVDKTPTLGQFTGNPGAKQILNPDSKLKYEAFLMNVAKEWDTDKIEAADTESDTDLV